MKRLAKEAQTSASKQQFIQASNRLAPGTANAMPQALVPRQRSAGLAAYLFKMPLAALLAWSGGMRSTWPG
jgi:hypothetical protein